MVRSSESLFLDGPVGRLEALHGTPPLKAQAHGEHPPAAAVVCHPNPAEGGTMHNTVVFRAARALQNAGIPTLRFNFRGVEESEGRHDMAGGEVDDAACALEWLSERYPGTELWAAGFSFGARTACALAAREVRVKRLICVALPVRVFEVPELLEVKQPGYLLFGSKDSFGTLSELAPRFPNLPSQLETDEIEGADHFFRGRTPILEDRIHRYALQSLTKASD